MKRDAHQLKVTTADGDQVGLITHNPLSGSFAFSYTAEWQKSGYPLSPSLAFNNETQYPMAIKRFIENLLPEGVALDALANLKLLSKSNLFGLIRAIGHESSGAFMFVSDSFFHEIKIQSRQIQSQEISERINSRDSIPFSVWDGRVRLSIAGYQDKIALFINTQNEMFLAERPLASTYIVKPVPRNKEIASLVANEHFCMSLARKIGLNAAATEIVRVPQPVLFIKRFDRIFNQEAGTVDRLHIIDACQLLDLPPSYKYERLYGKGRDVAHIRDGVSFGKLFAAIDLFDSPVQLKLGLLKWVFFQYLIGNSDAHGKNISFFVLPNGKLTLAPAYDLVSTVIYNGLNDDIAMSIGDEFTLSNIGAYQWTEFANECGIPLRLMRNQMQQTATTMLKYVTQHQLDVVITDDERHDINKISEFIKAQSHALLHDAQIMEVNKHEIVEANRFNPQ